MKMTLATVEITTTELTRNIVKQLDKFEPRGRTNDQLKEQVKALCRVEMPEGEVAILQDGEALMTARPDMWGRAFIEVWGRAEKLPKVILMK